MSGREEHRSSRRARQRRPNLVHYYRHRLGDIEPGDYEWRLFLHRPGIKGGHLKVLPLGPVATSISWTDDAPVLSGAVTLQRPAPDAVKSVPVRNGDRMRLKVKWGHRWYRLWDMRVDDDPEVDRGTGQLSCQLSDDLIAIDLDERDWEFKKDGAHPSGWTAQEITLHVCHKLGVKPGRIVKAKKKIKKLRLDGSTGLAVIKKAWAEERAETHKSYVIRLRNGKLDVVPVRRNRTLYEIKNTAYSETFTGTQKGAKPVTAIEATGRVNGKKVKVNVESERAMKRFGRRVQKKDYGKMDSRDAIREKAVKDLAAGLELNRQADLSIPLIPFLVRGDTIRLRTQEEGWVGPSENSRNRQFCFVTSVTHTVTPTSQESALHVNQHDPILSDRRQRDKDGRKNKQHQRDGRGGGGK